MRQRRQRRDAYQRLRDLPLYGLVEGWLLAGVSPKDVAVWVQASGYLGDIKERSVVRSLQRLRADLSPDDDERQDLLDELGELVELVEVNRERIDAGMELERHLGRLLPETLEVIVAQMDTLVQIHEIKKKLGLVPVRPPSEI